MKPADTITLSCVFNCYLKEGGDYTIDTHHPQFDLTKNCGVITLPLKNHRKTLVAKVTLNTLYPILKSELYDENNIDVSLSTIQAITLLISEIAIDNNLQKNTISVITRVLDSMHQMQIYLPGREYDFESIFAEKVSFQESEQALLTGHPAQPDPKSRVGFTEEDVLNYAPESRGEFKLEYFLVAKNNIEAKSNLLLSTEQLLKKLLVHDIYNDISFAYLLSTYPDYQLHPVHPWQARYLKQQSRFIQLIQDKKIIPLGAKGPDFYATTSVRTVYSRQSDFMFKFSLNIAITNSVRVNLYKELLRATASDTMMAGDIGHHLKQDCPDFTVICDPAYLIIKDDEGYYNETACIFRHNLFQTENNVTSIASLCQEDFYSDENRIFNLVRCVHETQNITMLEAARVWFEGVLEKLITPILGLYDKYGVALEAHQQNLLIAFENGMPTKSYYRDSQGFYYLEKNNPVLFDTVDNSLLDCLCACDEDFLTHHFCYYFIVNMLLGLIHAASSNNLIGKEELLSITKSFLIKLKKQAKGHSQSFLDYVLNSKTLPVKANLLTRLNKLDELQAPLSSQSIYVEMKNPFVAVSPYYVNLSISKRVAAEVGPAQFTSTTGCCS